MRAVVQRVINASVHIDGQEKSAIKQGLLILLGIEEADALEDINWLTKKIAQLRIFSDDQGLMNQSILEVQGEAMVVSQFTLHAKIKKGNRPSYVKAAKATKAIPLYQAFVKALDEALEKPVQTGVFGADMQIKLVNDGPVTLIIDTKNKE